MPLPFKTRQKCCRCVVLGLMPPPNSGRPRYCATSATLHAELIQNRCHLKTASNRAICHVIAPIVSSLMWCRSLLAIDFNLRSGVTKLLRVGDEIRSWAGKSSQIRSDSAELVGSELGVALKTKG